MYILKAGKEKSGKIAKRDLKLVLDSGVHLGERYKDWG